MWRPKTMNTDDSLYLAVADALERDIKNQTILAGERLPTHRELAKMIGINVSTATRAYKEAQRRGLISSTTGRGTFVTSDYQMNSSVYLNQDHLSSIIDLGPIYPLYNQEPDLASILKNISKDSLNSTFFQYSDPQGFKEHRKAGSLWLKRSGLDISYQDIIICAGTQHALTCCFTSLFQSGDSIGVDALTYSGIKYLAKRLGIKLVPIEFDQEGMLPDCLESACHREGLRGIYIMPNVHNPTTIQMSLSRKKIIAEIAIRHHLLVMEDDIFGFLLDNSTTSIHTLIPSQCIYIGGISKAFLAGLRVAFVVVPSAYMPQMIQGVLHTIWMAPTLNSALVADCIQSGLADEIIKRKLSEANKRLELAKKILQDFPFQSCQNSHFIWLNLPAGWTAFQFETKAIKYGVQVFPADKFVIGSTPSPAAVRISLTNVESSEQLSQGLNRLATILKNGPTQLDLFL